MKKRVFVLLSVVLIFSFISFASAGGEGKGTDTLKTKKGVAEQEAEDVPIRLLKIEPFTYCAVEMKGSFDQHASAFMTLFGAAGAQGLSMNQVPFGVYYNDPSVTPEEDLKWEIGFKIPEDADIQEPLAVKKWEHTMLVSKEYFGTFDSAGIGKVYCAMSEWMEKNGYVTCGPMMEKYLSMPEANEEGETMGKVEILIPVAKAGESGKTEECQKAKKQKKAAE